MHASSMQATPENLEGLRQKAAVLRGLWLLDGCVTHLLTEVLQASFFLADKAAAALRKIAKAAARVHECSEGGRFLDVGCFPADFGLIREIPFREQGIKSHMSSFQKICGCS